MFKRKAILIIILFSVFLSLQAQSSHQLFFLSDCQEPMTAEKIYLKTNHNEQARDSLFADIRRHQPEKLFLLGDLTSKGSSPSKWLPLDRFLKQLQQFHTKVYAIPGNHEYKMLPGKGIREYQKRFAGLSIYGYCVRTDSLAVIMLNSNFAHITVENARHQYAWYRQVLDSLDHDKAIKMVVVCAHHPPYSNSSIVGSSKTVEQAFIPDFNKSSKAKLFITGHSHNLEFFSKEGKNFLVIGGGGGLTQPLLPESQRKHKDLIAQDRKPVFFYLIIERTGNKLILTARGIKGDFGKFADLKIAEIEK